MSGSLRDSGRDSPVSSTCSTSSADTNSTQASLLQISDHVLSLLKCPDFLHGSERGDKLAQTYVHQFSSSLGQIRDQYVEQVF